MKNKVDLYAFKYSMLHKDIIYNHSKKISIKPQ